MSLHQLQAPSNRTSHAPEMQREDFLALACAVYRFQAAGAQAAQAIVSAQYGFGCPSDVVGTKSSEQSF